MEEGTPRLRAQRPLLKLLVPKRGRLVVTLAANVSANEAELKGNNMDIYSDGGFGGRLTLLPLGMQLTKYNLDSGLMLSLSCR